MPASSVEPWTQSLALAEPSRLTLYTQISLWMRRPRGTSLRGMSTHEPLRWWLPISPPSAFTQTSPRLTASP